MLGNVQKGSNYLLEKGTLQSQMTATTYIKSSKLDFCVCVCHATVLQKSGYFLVLHLHPSLLYLQILSSAQIGDSQLASLPHLFLCSIVPA